MLRYAILFVDAGKTVAYNVRNQSLSIMVWAQGQSFWPYWMDMQPPKKGRSHKAIISTYVQVPGFNILIYVMFHVISYPSSIVINLTNSIPKAIKLAGFYCAEYPWTARVLVLQWSTFSFVQMLLYFNCWSEWLKAIRGVLGNEIISEKGLQ